MPQITSSVAPNGLPIHRVALDGTRATTILVAFDAGARTERPEENGMAHFLEHLVFKGGQIYDDYRKVNETAERMGGSLNAYTSHDLVAFHITVRAEAAMEAIDLLTDFVGRPKIDPAELDKERGVVIQEIQRYKDQPAAVAEELIDKAHFGDHPLGRTVLGPEEHLRSFSRDAIVAFRERRWAGAQRRRVRRRQRRPRARQRPGRRAVRALPRPARARAATSRRRAFAPQTLVEQRDSNQSHLRMSYRPDVAVDDPQGARRASRSTRRCWAARWARACSTRSASSVASCYSVYATDHAYADVPVLQLGSGLDSSKCVEAYTRMREIVGELAADGPAREEVERARAYAAGRRVLAFENTNAVARYAANQTDRLRRGHRPRRGDRPARRGHLRRGRRGGPHGRPRGARRRLRRTAQERRVLIVLSRWPGALRSVTMVS